MEMNSPFKISLNIGLAYMLEKMGELRADLNADAKDIDDQYECFAGWLLDECDFRDWAIDAGYSRDHLPAAWVHIGRLIGRG
jgi:hypothetical protein